MITAVIQLHIKRDLRKGNRIGNLRISCNICNSNLIIRKRYDACFLSVLVYFADLEHPDNLAPLTKIRGGSCGISFQRPAGCRSSRSNDRARLRICHCFYGSDIVTSAAKCIHECLIILIHKLCIPIGSLRTTNVSETGKTDHARLETTGYSSALVGLARSHRKRIVTCKVDK